MTTSVVHVAQPTSEGVARCVVGLVRQQVASGLRVTVVCPSGGTLAEEAASAGAVWVRWEAQRSPGPVVLAETARLRRILRSLQPDLVHLHSAKAGLAGRLAVRGAVPTVYQPHAWSFRAVEGPLGRATLLWERWALRWTSRVVCVSDSELDEGRPLGDLLTEKACVVPNGVDVDRFAPRSRAAARLKLGLPTTPLAVCVGRLSKQKGQDLLLQAWTRIAEQVPGARLVLVGSGPWHDKLAAMAGTDVTFVGNSVDPRDWYAAADVVVAPSRWEGMALVPLEAGASGRSVVVSEVAGAHESVPPQAGALVALEDLESLAAAVALRLADPALADREGAAARDHVVSCYNLGRSGARMQLLYEELLSTFRPATA